MYTKKKMTDFKLVINFFCYVLDSIRYLLKKIITICILQYTYWYVTILCNI